MLDESAVKAAALTVKTAEVVHRHFGGHKAVARPVPIPNTAVKHSLADGSGFIDSARVGCRQFFKKAEDSIRVFGFSFFHLLSFSGPADLEPSDLEHFKGKQFWVLDNCLVEIAAHASRFV